MSEPAGEDGLLSGRDGASRPNRGKVDYAAAAEFVLQEQLRELELEKRRASAGEEVVEEEVVSGWEGDGIGDVDEDEMERKQRALNLRLAKKEKEIKEQAVRLHSLREKLLALEAPLKAEIFRIRQALEETNKRESGLVGKINAMRKELRSAEEELAKVRVEKRANKDELFKVMADYEKRKNDRLEEISSVIGDHDPATTKTSQNFSGF